jgi:hypothetical protein
MTIPWRVARAVLNEAAALVPMREPLVALRCVYRGPYGLAVPLVACLEAGEGG